MEIFTLKKLCESPEVERRVHVGKLIRYRGGGAQDFLDDETAESPAFGRAAARETYEKMREGRFTIFVIKGEPFEFEGCGDFKEI